MRREQLEKVEKKKLSEEEQRRATLQRSRDHALAKNNASRNFFLFNRLKPGASRNFLIFKIRNETPEEILISRLVPVSSVHERATARWRAPRSDRTG